MRNPMKTRTAKLTMLVAGLAGGALALSACSGGGGGDGDGATGDSSTGALVGAVTTEFSTEVDPDAAAMLPDDVTERGVLRIAKAVPYPPFDAFDDDNKVVGVDVDLAEALGKKLDIKIEYQHQPFESVIPSLQADKHDVIMMGMNDSLERQETLSFIEEIRAGFAIIVKKGNPENITTLNDLCGHPVSTQKSTVQAELLQELSEKCEADGKKGLDIQALPVAQDSQTALHAGRADAYVVDAPVGAFTAATAGDGEYFEMVQDPENPQGFNPVYTGFGVMKDRTGLIDALQAAMQDLIDEGIYADVLASYDLTPFAIDSALVNAADQ